MTRTGTLELGLPGMIRRARWTGSTLPALFLGRQACPQCGVGELIPQSPVEQPALFLHGGYGETTRTTAAVCLACSHVEPIRVEAVRPRPVTRLYPPCSWCGDHGARRMTPETVLCLSHYEFAELHRVDVYGGGAW